MAAHLRDTGFDLGYAPRWVTTGAESLLPQQRALVEEAFGVRPRQRYVMAEVVAGASECERGLLHLDEDLAATELLPAGGAGAFRVVGTNFTNLAMPLLRYETSDLVRPAAGPCGCGRPGRLLAAIDGRADDYIVTASGAVVGTSTAGNIALVDVDLREAQLVQERPGAIVFRVVPRRQLTESDEAALVASARKYLGTDMEVSVEEVASLPRTPSGKVRYIVSSVPGSRLADIGPSARDSADGAQ
jgi:phenylacetate-CoA ligase